MNASTPYAGGFPTALPKDSNNDRTLDQSYYYMLKDTTYRDRTQVVSRWVKSEWPEQEDHNILMVDQLWLWFVKSKKEGEPDTIITSFPSREGAEFQQSSREVDDLQGTVLGDDNRTSISASTDLVSRILSVCCNAFDRHQNVESVNFLQFFESAIGRAVSSHRTKSHIQSLS